MADPSGPPAPHPLVSAANDLPGAAGRFSAERAIALARRTFDIEAQALAAVAARQGEDAGHAASVELALLLTHGVLHLLGHDHAEPDEHEVMFALQAELLQDWLAASR